ncbi:PfkB family carbohydrate kinase [Magnetospirillum sp. UT-4]|uniref:PfkB family carbohydrate kinase n=1 Tax=Magnetospirillum sp. UT-4 TaxID=2681467 RepID=UPI00137FE42B|nr:PfkB family carbohydrate kinase [Magnetospirillum sp. UT-4]CAA7612109.1 D-glycero-D-manno-heptose-1-phosphate adenylyltransferase [Magnetospirillum sp. UT-4]
MISLTDRFKHKIKTVDELIEVLGPRPRKRKAIMCHGVFDVVHPGHLRHLIYAKSKADILIASLTADRHIAKGQHRPHVPQDLRALNLAAFEIVDYVIIDPNDKPIDNLLRLQPDYFAKGYEYTATGLPPKTQEEVETVGSYGGEVIFTPGDIVYSSSRLIELEPPNLKTEKLLTLMDMAGIGFDDLRAALGRFAGKRVHVLGDTIVDSLTQCAMIGGQTKTPTMSVLFQERKDYIGGAAVVAEHIRAAGAEVVFSTVLGDDPHKDFVLEGLKESGVDCRAIIDPTRPTTNKNAIVAGGYRLLKVDTLDNRSISDEVVAKLGAAVRSTPADAVVFADFRHGIFNRRTIPALVGAIPDNTFKVADSQVASRWGNITEFQGFDLITPNEREARFALADQDSGVRPLAVQVYEAAKAKVLILKLGDRGVLTCRSHDHESLDSFFVVDSFVDRVVDAVGAGDALLAYSTLSMLATGDPVVATIIGSMAAAVECECDGNIPVRPDDVLAKIDAVEARAKYER